MEGEVPTTLPYEVLYCPKVHIGGPKPGPGTEAQFLLCQHSNVLLLLLLWFFIIRRAGGLGLVIQVDNLLVDVFHHLPDLQHVTGRQSVFFKVFAPEDA